jgi:hypothetical protein
LYRCLARRRRSEGWQRRRYQRGAARRLLKPFPQRVSAFLGPLRESRQVPPHPVEPTYDWRALGAGVPTASPPAPKQHGDASCKQVWLGGDSQVGGRATVPVRRPYWVCSPPSQGLLDGGGQRTCPCGQSRLTDPRTHITTLSDSKHDPQASGTNLSRSTHRECRRAFVRRQPGPPEYSVPRACDIRSRIREQGVQLAQRSVGQQRDRTSGHACSGDTLV